MGSETGQDNERPVHRVWVDAFELAQCQVTHGEYAQFLAATDRAEPVQWNDANFSHPRTGGSWRFLGSMRRHIANGSAVCQAAVSLCRRRPNGSGLRAAGSSRRSFPGATSRRRRWRDYASRWKTGPEPVGVAERNAYGLCDIGANVHEWCADWFGADYYAVVAGTQSAGAFDRDAAGFARRVVAALHEGVAVRGAVEHPPRISICRLWISRGVRWLGKSERYLLARIFVL